MAFLCKKTVILNHVDFQLPLLNQLNYVIKYYHTFLYNCCVVRMYVLLFHDNTKLYHMHLTSCVLIFRAESIVLC